MRDRHHSIAAAGFQGLRLSMPEANLSPVSVVCKRGRSSHESHPYNAKGCMD